MGADGQKTKGRLGSGRGQIGQRDRERSPAKPIRRHPAGLKVDPFDQGVLGNDQGPAGWSGKNRSVVSARHDEFLARRGGPLRLPDKCPYQGAFTDPLQGRPSISKGPGREFRELSLGRELRIAIDSDVRHGTQMVRRVLFQRSATLGVRVTFGDQATTGPRLRSR